MSMHQEIFLQLILFRSFLVFPLRLTIPGIGEFRKEIGSNKNYNGRPVYTHIEGKEIIFYRGNLGFIV